MIWSSNTSIFAGHTPSAHTISRPASGGKILLCFDTIANDPEINIVVEVMGGIDPAYHFVKTCLQKGKSVATANKELIANKGAELLSIAKQNHVNILFEASVGGGIPIIRPLHQCLGANEIDDIQGILNGTTNFILTKMIRENMNFADALSLAQKLGYAEADLPLMSRVWTPAAKFAS